MEVLKVKFWRGTRALYNSLGEEGKLDYATRYTVIESDGTRSEYFGAKPITEKSGLLYPVKSIVDTLPSTLNVGDRYLVGSGSEYYVVEIAADMSQSTITPLGKYSVKVEDKNMNEYFMYNNQLTCSNIIDCGTF